MVSKAMLHQIEHKPGFIAALDQSGGSTPSALHAYGVPDVAFGDQEHMFDLIHAMRQRIIRSPSFTGEKIIGAILFEDTMNRDISGVAAPTYLWDHRGVVPFVKVDKGLEAERLGVRLMKPIPALRELLGRAAEIGLFGTKMRSVIRLPDPEGVAAIVHQQFAFAREIIGAGLVPIIEPEVLITSPAKHEAEILLRGIVLGHLDALPETSRVLLKLTIPTIADQYTDLVNHDRVIRVLALSGGYDREIACRLLTRNHGMIASFSRALIHDLRVSQDDEEFDRLLSRAIEQIYQASSQKSELAQ